MTSYEPPVGTFPLVFESGVVNLDEDGVLHVHLSHSQDSPHPMMTHPDGDETTIPATVTEVELVGSESSSIKVRCGMTETSSLPEGMVFHIKGWRLLQLEMSGDLTIVMAEMEQVPAWFQPGKIHRFDGPEDGVRLFTGSQPLIESREEQPRPTATRPRPQPPKNKSTTANKTTAQPHGQPESQAAKGCALLTFLMIATATGLAVIPFSGLY